MVQSLTRPDKARTVKQPSPSGSARRWLFGLLACAALVNIFFAVVQQRMSNESFQTSHPGLSKQLVDAVPIDAERLAAATNDNRVVIIEDGEEIQEIQLDDLIGGIAVDVVTGAIYVGTSTGAVLVLDSELSQVGELRVVGRVVALQAAPEGGLIVGYGEGAYSDQYEVNFYPDYRADSAFTVMVGAPLTQLSVIDNDVLFGTRQARVGLIRADGGEPSIAWTVTLKQTITALHALPGQDRVVVGDEGGNLSVLTTRGEVLSSFQVSSYPLRSLAFQANNYIVGDQVGNVYVIGESGDIRLTTQISASDVEELVPVDDGAILVVPRDGPWTLLDPSAVNTVTKVSEWRAWWYGTNAALIGTLLITATLMIRRLRLAVSTLAVRMRRAWAAYVLVLPATLLIAAFSYYPAALAFYYSMTSFSIRAKTEFIGLQNYERVLTDDFYFRTGMFNLVIIVLASVVKTITVPLLVAELVFWLRNGVHRYLFRTLFVLPAVVPDLIFTLLWRQVYDPRTGLINQLLDALGLEQWQRAWLADERTALWAVVGVGFPFVSAFGFLILLAGLLNINGDYYDAATIDGAGWWRRFRDIDLPLLIPQFRILLFFAITGAIQGFALIYILTRGGPGYATYVPPLQMYLRISNGDFGYASAIGIILFILILVLTLFVLRFRRDEAEAG